MQPGRIALALLTVVLSTTLACSGSPTGPSDLGGNFRVMMRDSPYRDAKAVLVTFSSVEVHRTGGAAYPVPFAGGASFRTCDLKKLESAQDILGTASLEAGKYTMVRLVVFGAVVYYDNPSAGSACAPVISMPAGRSATLDIPSGEVKLNRPFEVVATGTTTMVLDFKGDESIHETGNGRLLMSPVIAVVSVQLQ